MAKELGIDSKELIEYASRAGIKIKNSALASISPEERDIILQVMKDAEASSKSTADRSMAPVREAAPEGAGRIRNIKTMVPQPHGGGRAMREPPVEPPQSTSVAVEEPPEELPPDDEQPQAIEPDLEPIESAVEVAAEAPTGPGDVVPISRDDYVSASGSIASAMREMKPRGTVQTNEAMARKPKPKPKSVLPGFAAPPAYKAPKPKKSETEEQPTQKPDVKLTPDILLKQSPLASHLRKHVEQRQHRKPGEPLTPADFRTFGGRPDEEFSGSEVQKKERRRQTKVVDTGDEGEATTRSPRRRRQRGSAPVALKTQAEITTPITIRSLSEAIGRPARALLKVLFDRGSMVTINETIPEDLALDIAMEIGVELEIKRPRDTEDELAELLAGQGGEEDMASRPPIVTILGHVDHGKTSLIDKIRSANVAAGEAGGITQHIAAYQVEHNGQKITFVDTPGHAAFGEMRARGANVTDIVVLVIAADDSVMPQTVECISHAKAAKVPMIVAMNKTDLPGTNQQKVLQDLTAHEILPAEWGGDTEVVRTSAVTGAGIDQLLETILVSAELNEYKANPNQRAVGVCLEAFRDEGRGALAWLIVQKGTLRIGDIVLCGPAYGRIRAIYNDRDEEITEAGPSLPVKVAGLNMVPGAGDHFFVMNELEEARKVAESRQHRGRTELLSGRRRPRTLDDILTAARGGTVQDLPLIIKADTPGSIEALRSEIGKIDHPEVRVAIVHEGVGGVNESDVYLASASGAIVIAFHVVAEDRAATLADREGIDIRRYNIIYEVTATIKRALEGLLEPERVEVATGRALVLRTFHTSRFGTIAGCRVLNGTIERTNRVHVIRDQTVLNHYAISSLRREKDDVREVREGMECGIRLDGYNDVKEGDLLESFRVDEIKRTLE